MIVVKVGGSLFDHPRLGPGLRAYLDSLAPAEVLLVPGGGAVAEAVRKLDAVHRLGEEASHWLALRALGVTGAYLDYALQSSSSQATKNDFFRISDRVRVLDCHKFVMEDEMRPERLPHSWDVTSDSIAARAAVVLGAGRLVLLKSVDVPPGTPWAEAAERGWVDRYFPHAVAGAPFAIEVVNFRRALDSSPG